MFAEERHENIITMIKTNGTVKVKDLSSEFRVTEDCIRKDLTYLEKEGYLRRIYGGAVLPRQNLHSFEVEKRKNLNTDAKKVIAAKAMDLIHNGDTIYLDVSTTNIHLSNLLLNSSKEVIVVTNMIEIVSILSKNRNIRVISVGGMLNRPGDAFVGSMSNEIIGKFKFDLSFMGVVGVDVNQNNVSTYDVDDGITKFAAAAASKKVYLEAEEIKFHMDGNYKYMKLSNVTGIIVDKKLPEKILRELQKYNITVI
ncbi:MAG: DeoR/GlpR transcriptional regulator [Eubacteriaceae bacterium]|nr:DeoR/GlpR transcriptional regulator [Eubacteriaceae bacterium]